MEIGNGPSCRPQPWVPGTVAIDKLYDLNEYYETKEDADSGENIGYNTLKRAWSKYLMHVAGFKQLGFSESCKEPKAEILKTMQ